MQLQDTDSNGVKSPIQQKLYHNLKSKLAPLDVPPFSTPMAPHRKQLDMLHSVSDTKSEADFQEWNTLKTELKRALSHITELTNKYDSLQKEIKQMKKMTSILVDKATKRSLGTARGLPYMERNVEELRTLSCEQVRIITATKQSKIRILIFMALISEFPADIGMYSYIVTDL